MNTRFRISKKQRSVTYEHEDKTIGKCARTAVTSFPIKAKTVFVRIPLTTLTSTVTNRLIAHTPVRDDFLIAFTAPDSKETRPRPGGPRVPPSGIPQTAVSALDAG